MPEQCFTSCISCLLKYLPVQVVIQLRPVIISVIGTSQNHILLPQLHSGELLALVLTTVQKNMKHLCLNLLGCSIWHISTLQLFNAIYCLKFLCMSLSLEDINYFSSFHWVILNPLHILTYLILKIILWRCYYYSMLQTKKPNPKSIKRLFAQVIPCYFWNRDFNPYPANYKASYSNHSSICLIH